MVLNPRLWQQNIPFFWIELYQLVMKIRSVSFNLVDQIRKNRKDMPYFMVIYVISPYSMVISPDLKVNSPVVPGLTWSHLPRPFAPFAVRIPEAQGTVRDIPKPRPDPVATFWKGTAGGDAVRWLKMGLGFDGLTWAYLRKIWWYSRYLASGSLLLFAIENGDL